MMIDIPDHTIDLGGQTLDFAWFVTALTESDGRFCANAEALRAARRIRKVLPESVLIKMLQISDADGEVLKAASENPTGGYPVLSGPGGQRSLGLDCLPFIDAIAAGGSNA